MKYINRALLFFMLLSCNHALSNQVPSFSVNNLPVPLPLFSVFVLPGEEVKVSSPTALLEASVSGTTQYRQNSNDSWSISTPNTSEVFILKDKATGDQHFQLNLLVVQPSEQAHSGFIDHFQVGHYPTPREQYQDVERMPKGFLRVSPRMVDMPLTPNMILRRFLSKQASDFPKYVYVNEKLLLLLESFLKTVKKQGYNINSFAFVSGFRTPFYNERLGNIVYSPHIFGDAADIYIDADGDHRLDDLNRDGLINQSDTRFLIGLAERFKKSTYGAKFVGGIGHYPPTKQHGGFIHLDTRGYKARW